jgi:hypothetical protein
MSTQALEEVLRKAANDPAYRARLKDDFDGATRSYDLSTEEKSQLLVQAGGGVEKAQSRRAAMVTAEQVTAEQVTAEQVTAEQVTAEQVTAEQVTAEQVTAEQVTAEETDTVM